MWVGSRTACLFGGPPQQDPEKVHAMPDEAGVESSVLASQLAKAAVFVAPLIRVSLHSSQPEFILSFPI